MSSFRSSCEEILEKNFDENDNFVPVNKSLFYRNSLCIACDEVVHGALGLQLKRCVWYKVSESTFSCSKLCDLSYKHDPLWSKLCDDVELGVRAKLVYELTVKNQVSRMLLHLGNTKKFKGVKRHVCVTAAQAAVFEERNESLLYLFIRAQGKALDFEKKDMPMQQYRVMKLATRETRRDFERPTDVDHDKRTKGVIGALVLNAKQRRTYCGCKDQWNTEDWEYCYDFEDARFFETREHLPDIRRTKSGLQVADIQYVNEAIRCGVIGDESKDNDHFYRNVQKIFRHCARVCVCVMQPSNCNPWMFSQTLGNLGSSSKATRKTPASAVASHAVESDRRVREFSGTCGSLSWSVEETDRIHPWDFLHVELNRCVHIHVG